MSNLNTREDIQFFVDEDETTRINFVGPLEGHWIEVRNELSYGERERLSSSSFGKINLSSATDNETNVSLDMEKYNVERFLAWVVDWSFTDANKRSVKISRAAITKLSPSVADEIDAVLSVHIQEKLDQKKVKGRVLTLASK